MTWNDKLFLARQLRQRQTPAEKIAWEALRRKQVLGYKFKRQHIIQGFIVDFYCTEFQLVIELDGEIHDIPEVHSEDIRREIILKSLGIIILRIKNYEILNCGDVKSFLAGLITKTLAREAGEGAR